MSRGGRSGRMEVDRLRKLLRTYLVIGSPNCREDPLQVLEAALDGGVTLVQFREKGPGALAGEPLRALAVQLQAACRRRGVPFLVNDDVELALAIDADGVHVGQEDETAARVRARIGDRILGVSAHTAAEAERAVEQGADYLGIGPIYPTASKADAKPPQGPAVLRELRALGIAVPLVGIGGITAETAGEVIRAGADGVAVISAITLADEVREAASRLFNEVAEASS
ncbi:thiamine phosphate synthase [Paenibacillus phocaensis]|uniref:thiamine phosphate synthase n=1 Tax=Paenibacillus phocaensis TaxID=1776378 RepID=UPI000839CBE6|nr:thiamine phosphate synthase [Paenibacillus phocaensis]